MAIFVFLEIIDPDINALFSAFSQAINGEKPKKATHLTIRGPYSKKVSKKLFGELNSIMEYDVLQIGGVGKFSNPDEHVVYLKVDSPHLRQVWYKPDYPIKKYGFNPHISIYRGNNLELADKLYDFFLNEKLLFNCAEFQIATYVSKSSDRILIPDQIPIAEYPERLKISGKIKPDLIERLQKLVQDTIAG